ncbi:MAG TPA: biopolymer transporter ExbD [Anaerohalosphaeraceae bacterium]|jgi:biopolymer transport protein ExbD|nr:biopolymer transporter ExbD [Anaerohalosphaeraceae bacterium]
MKQGLFYNRLLANESFDMTPVIDVAFLLIIFFMLVCQFMAAENFEILVPGQIATAVSPQADQDLMTTVTVMKDAGGQVRYAVGSEILDISDIKKAPEQIAQAIDRQLRLLDPSRRIVRLRCEKSLPFGASKYALVGIGQSSATDIQWAVLPKE